jgi:hypothetical protein
VPSESRDVSEKAEPALSEPIFSTSIAINHNNSMGLIFGKNKKTTTKPGSHGIVVNSKDQKPIRGAVNNQKATE